MTDINEVASDVISKTYDVSVMYYRLVLLVGSGGSGKTRVLREVERRLGAPRVNLSLELGRRLIGTKPEEKGKRTVELFQSMLDNFVREDGTPFDTVLLDDIEILLESEEISDPLELLQNASRNRTLIVGWPGRVDEGFLTTYIEGPHRGIKRYSSLDLALVEL